MEDLCIHEEELPLNLCDTFYEEDCLKLKINDFIEKERNSQNLQNIPVKEFRKIIPMMLIYCFFDEKKKSKKGIV